MDRPELRKRPANYVPLSPVSFLKSMANFWGGRLAVVHGERRFNYAEFYARCRRFASALSKAGIGRGDTVAIMAANTPAMLEAHFAVPMLGAVLNPINYRLDAPLVRFCLEHGEAKVFIADREFHAVIKPALDAMETKPLVIDLADAETTGLPAASGLEYEDFLKTGDPNFDYPGAEDEWDSLCLLYTSGTTGNPKGVVYSHRGAYLTAMSVVAFNKMDQDCRYLWTLPMFHCSGWTFTWAVTAAGGTHYCIRRVDPKRIYELIAEYEITNLCGAPIVLNMLANFPKEQRAAFSHKPHMVVGGAAPPAAIIKAIEEAGFSVLHGYGATESYGPSTHCVYQSGWEIEPLETRYAHMARQGVPACTVEDLMVATLDSVQTDTLKPVPRDGKTLGEVVVRGNTIMKGYLKNPAATDDIFRGGFYRSGDLAVWHEDNYIEVKDRSKDIIISGGENISSLEVEDMLYKHPAVLEAAVVARPDPKWGETPCAFITLKPGAPKTTEEDIIAFCRANLAGFKVPRTVVFTALPKTSTGKIQKFMLRDKVKALAG